MRAKIITIQILLLFLTTSFISAQKDNSINDKIDNIKGAVNKIIISTDNEEIVFEGDDAKKIFTKMKTHKLKKLRWVSEDNDFDRDNVFILKHDNDDDYDLDIIEDGKTINVNVEVNDEDGEKKVTVTTIEDGEKKVTVTTIEDGEEKVETYEGKDAEEYLEIMGSENEMDIEIIVDSDFDDGVSNEKDVKIEVNDGVKIITETITENGEKSVKVYEGNEAEEYLKEQNEKEERILIKEKIKDGKKHKRVIIKKNIEKE